MALPGSRLLPRALLAGAVLGLAGLSAGIWLGSELAAPAAAHVETPADLPVEAVAISSPSGSTLAGWFVPGAPDAGAVVLLHGVRANRDSLLARARFLHQAGYGLLLFDFQAHGESPGRHITFGHLESRDARAALGWMRRRLPSRKVGAIGVSLGGASILIGDQPAGFDAVVLEAVFPTLAEAVEARMRSKIGGLSSLVTPALLAQAGPRFGFSPAALRPIDGIGRIGAPVLVLAGSEDRYTPLAQSQRLFAAASPPKELWVLAGAGHANFHRFAGREYEARILEFFRSHLR